MSCVAVAVPSREKRRGEGIIIMITMAPEKVLAIGRPLQARWGGSLEEEEEEVGEDGRMGGG